MKRLLLTAALTLTPLSVSTTVLAAETVRDDAPSTAAALSPAQMARIGALAEEGQARAAALAAAGDDAGAELANLETMLAILEVMTGEAAD
jgi:hypothetical protein